MNSVHIECIGTALTAVPLKVVCTLILLVEDLWTYLSCPGLYRKFNYMTPVLHDLHWLPLWLHTRFKLGMTIYKCLIVLAPVHMASDCVPVSLAFRYLADDT